MLRTYSIRKLLELDRNVLLVVRKDPNADLIRRATLRAKLSEAEFDRLMLFADEPSSWRFSVGRLMLREAVSQICDVDPRSVSIQIEMSGKPKLEHPASIAMSISHSGPFVAILLAAGSECGIDIEAVQDIPEILPIHERFFSSAEMCWLDEVDCRMERGQRFLRLWTRKEAYLKATGEGLSGLSSRLNFSEPYRCEGADGFRISSQLGVFWVFDVAGNADYYLSACFEQKPSQIQLVSLSVGGLERSRAIGL